MPNEQLEMFDKSAFRCDAYGRCEDDWCPINTIKMYQFFHVNKKQKIYLETEWKEDPGKGCGHCSGMDGKEFIDGRWWVRIKVPYSFFEKGKKDGSDKTD